jgi:hypothetical protein
MAGRLVHRSTDNLPAAAFEIMTSGFRSTKTFHAIAQELAAAGFAVSERTVARRSVEWRAQNVQREALRVSSTEAPRTDWLVEVTGIVEVLDHRPGWKYRARGRVMKAVSGFLDEPTVEAAQKVSRELLRFRLETLIWQVRSVGAASGMDGTNQPASPAEGKQNENETTSP